jgi:hypothetical protein
MSVSIRLLLAASLSLAPLGWAAAQDQQQRDEQHRREQQEQQKSPQQPKLNQQQQHAVPPQGNTAPQGKGAGGPGVGQQFQRPAQTNAAPPNPQSFQRPAQNNAPPSGVQTFQRPAQTNAAPPSPPAGTAVAPTPPTGQNQFRRVQGPPQTGGAAPTGSAQQQQFEQRSVRRGGAPVGAVAPLPQSQQQTTISRGNFQGTRSGNTAAFSQRHSGAAPTQFRRGLFYGRDYAHFTPRESALWRSGAWRREFHDGRFGWWYIVDGIWYFYTQPVYPYPTFIPDVVYIPDEESDYDDDVSADPGASLPNGVFYANGVYYYYYCPSLQAYYPYVGTCPSPWQTVPATPQ